MYLKPILQNTIDASGRRHRSVAVDTDKVRL